MIDELTFSYILAGFMMVICFCYFYFNTYRWIGLKRRFSKRNWGIIRFRAHGKNEFPMVVDFDKDTVNFYEGIYILERGKIYRQIGDEKHYKGEIDIKKASFNQGCPIINFDLNDMVSLSLERAPIDPSVPRSPQQIESTLRKVRSALEAETHHATQKEMKRLVMMSYVSVILMFLALGLIAYTFMQVDRIGAMLASYIQQWTALQVAVVV
jgi:hypothetical protein